LRATRRRADRGRLRHRRAAPAALGSAAAVWPRPHPRRAHRPRARLEEELRARRRGLPAHRTGPARSRRGRGGSMSARPSGEALLAALESGEVRAAERAADGTWTVNVWVKEG